MRCLALAQEWIHCGGSAILIGRIEGKSLLERIKDFGLKHISFSADSSTDSVISAVLDYAQKTVTGSWIVLDNYSLTTGHQKQIWKNFPRLLVIDDYHHINEYCAGMILNQNIGAENISYKTNEETRILAGTSYAMLRDEFRNDTSHSLDEQKTRIIITMGGADAGNVTLSTLRAIEALKRPDLKVSAILGPANPHVKSITEFVDNSSLDVDVLVDVKNMSSQISKSDLAITAGGSSCWEMCAMSVPMIVIVTAENQKELSNGLAKADAAINLGNADELKESTVSETIKKLLDAPARMKLLAESAKKLIDGNGVQRIISAMQEAVILRPATYEDRDQIFEWINDPETRKWSYNQAPIKPEEHDAWFTSRLADEEFIYLIAENGSGQNIGQIRFENIGKNYEAHVLVSKNCRGKGAGAKLIRSASLRLIKEKEPKQIIAKAKEDNIASIKSFQKAGYIITGKIAVNGSESVVMKFTGMPEE